MLLAVVFVLGFAAYQNHQKMNDMQNALAQINTQAVSTEEKAAETAKEVKIEQVEGNVEKQNAAETSEQNAAGEQTANGETAVSKEQVAVSPENAGNTADVAGTDTISTGTIENSSGNGTATPDSAGKETETTGAAGAGAGVTETGGDTSTGAGEKGGTTDSSGTENGSSETGATGNSVGDGDPAGTQAGGTDTTAASTEAQTYLKQGYYIVQKGDSLVAICRKIYQTTAMMDEVCKANNIEDPNDIYAGQYLTLPN